MILNTPTATVSTSYTPYLQAFQLQEKEILTNIHTTYAEEANQKKSSHTKETTKYKVNGTVPVWKTTSLPPTPAASKLMKALTCLAHGCWVMKPWLAWERNGEKKRERIIEREQRK